ncbi:recombinase family protein [Dehalobacter restrictus]|jgi:DNA invertase Pin-like site-specific DNA recombinase|uniref:recombinase family protein n=1 Tax=Dehalobacter restrictus TaxID=55583 RepID=UPI00338DD40F
MARVSRRKDSLAAQAASVIEIVYDTAVYARLSSEDNGVGADSMDNQIYMLKKHIEEKPELRLRDVYSDNGASGTNFDRPDFIRLMEDVRKGRINCIVVKDLSRFGRNYIETGNYLEKIFPYLGVRFISVNDGYDSAKPSSTNEGLMVSLKNLVYDVYAKDTSKKISDAYEGKQKKGKFIGDFAPYGYSKDPEDKNKLIINEETAPVVREIYRMRLDGIGITAIARRLNEMGIVPPSRYLYDKGIVTNEYYASTKLWSVHSISNILQSPTYIGNITQRKNISAYYKGIKTHKNPKENWVIVENTHEPIINSDSFYQVQELIEQSKQRYHTRLKASREKYGDHKENILRGIMTCGDCGAKLSFQAGTRKKDGQPYAYLFVCLNRYRKKGFCSTPNIKYDFVIDGIKQAVQAQIRLASDMRRIIGEAVQAPLHQERQNQICREIESINQRLQNVSNRKYTLYEAYVGKLMMETDYIYAKRKYEQDILAMQERLNALQAEMDAFTETLSSNNKWITTFQKYAKAKEVTREMISELISCVKVFGQKSIEITFNHQDEYEKLAAYLKTRNEAEVQAV